MMESSRIESEVGDETDSNGKVVLFEEMPTKMVLSEDADSSLLSCIDSHRNVLVVTNSDGNQQIVGSLVSNEELQNGTENVYILNDAQMLDSKDKQIITIDGHVLVTSDHVSDGVNQFITTEELETENKQVLSADTSDIEANYFVEDDIEGIEFDDLYDQEFDKITKKLASVEKVLNKFHDKSLDLDNKVNSLYSSLVKAGCFPIQQEKFGYESNVTVSAVSEITKSNHSSSSEDEYPNGSWLGDASNCNKRVRCNISPVILQKMNVKIKTPEKMALTLLDQLFDREIQAISNISGAGKYGKRQLNPVLIYGIKCHLNYHFNITDKDWQKIQMKMDSKCRTAFRKKVKGMPLTVKRTCYSDTLSTEDIECGTEHYVTQLDHFEGELVADSHTNINSNALQQLTSATSNISTSGITVSNSQVRTTDGEIYTIVQR